MADCGSDLNIVIHKLHEQPCDVLTNVFCLCLAVHLTLVFQSRNAWLFNLVARLYVTEQIMHRHMFQ